MNYFTQRYSFFNTWVCSTNHKIIGMLYLFFGTFTAFLATFMSLLIRRELGDGPVLFWRIFCFLAILGVHSIIISAFGVVGQVLTVFCTSRIFGNKSVVGTILAIGFLGWFVCAYHMFTVGMDVNSKAYFSAVTMIIGIPTGIKIFNWFAKFFGLLYNEMCAKSQFVILFVGVYGIFLSMCFFMYVITHTLKSTRVGYVLSDY